MFEKFTTEGGDTFRRRYEGTYGYFVNKTNPNLPLLVQLVSFEGNNGEILRFKRLDGIMFTLNANTEKEIGFEFTPPEKRWYPHPVYGAVLGARRPARQFSRGLCDANYTLQYYNVKNIRWEELPVNFQEVANILEGPKKNISSLEVWLKAGQETTAYYLSPTFSLLSGRKVIHLALFDRFIAQLKFEGDKLTVMSRDVIFDTEYGQVAALLGKELVYGE